MGKGIPLHSEIIVKKHLYFNLPPLQGPCRRSLNKVCSCFATHYCFLDFFPFCSYHLCLRFLILVFQLLELLLRQALRDLFPCFVVDGAAGPAPVAQQRQRKQQPSDLHIVPACRDQKMTLAPCGKRIGAVFCFFEIMGEFGA